TTHRPYQAGTPLHHYRSIQCHRYACSFSNPALLMKLSVQLVNPGGQLFVRPCDGRIRDDVADGQRPHPGSRYVQLGQPMAQLRAGARIDDAPQSDPAMSGRTHGAMLARGIYRGTGSVLGAHVLRRPTGNGEFRMLGMITTG